ncbi:MAG: type II secretion system protein [Pyrinomonadaceae bacterium]|nr:type II secretion system protein [Pyrinomonadaceae bacterium]
MTSRNEGCKEKRHLNRRPLKSPFALNDNRERSGERGYTLVALLATMAIILLLISAAAPSIRQQAQRSREEEAIARGEEVAEAIRIYTIRKGLPTSMDELLEGVPVGSKKVQVLRPSAAIDPLSSSGKWKLVKKTDATFLAFQRAVTVYAGGRTPNTTDAAFLNRVGPLPVVTNILDIDSKEEAPGGEDDSEDSTGPFIGVVSRSRRASVITYYGIERHDQWVFTPYFR